jgi:hypothetical protein
VLQGAGRDVKNGRAVAPPALFVVVARL